MHIAQTEVGVCSMVIAKDGMYPKETPLNGKGKLTSVRFKLKQETRCALLRTRRPIPKCEEVGWLINLAHSCSLDWTLSGIKSHSVKQKTEISPKDHHSVDI